MGSQSQLERKHRSKSKLLKGIDELKKELSSGETEENAQKEIIEVKEAEEEPAPERNGLQRDLIVEGYEWAENHEKYPWMYWMPTRKDELAGWVDEWADFMLRWFKINRVHYIPLIELMERKPFIFLQNKVDALKLIVDKLIDRKFCQYTDRGEKSIRVVWRGIEDWGDVIYSWAFKRGMVDFNLFEIMDLEESTDNFHELPPEELKKIFGALVKNKKARWISKKRCHIELLF